MSTRQVAGSGRLRRALALVGCGMLALGASACESTEQESAKIGRESEAAAARAAKAAKTSRSRGHAHGHARPAHAAAGAHK